MAQVENAGLLRGINFAALVMDGFDAKTLNDSRQALEEAGATLRIISAQLDPVRGVGRQGQPDQQFDVHLSLDDADPQEFAGALLPAGARHIEQLRQIPSVCSFLQDMAREGKPVAALSEGVALLADAGLVKDRSVTGHPDFKDAVIQAGGKWVERSVMVDDFLASARGIEDLPEFIDAALTLMGSHVRQSVEGTRDENPVIGPSG